MQPVSLHLKYLLSLRISHKLDIYFQHSTLSHTTEIILHEELVSIATIIKITNTFSLLSEFLQVSLFLVPLYQHKQRHSWLCQSYSFIFAFLEPLLHLPCYLRGISPPVLYIHCLSEASVCFFGFQTHPKYSTSYIAQSMPWSKTHTSVAGPLSHHGTFLLLAAKIILTVSHILTSSLKYHTYLAVCTAVFIWSSFLSAGSKFLNRRNLLTFSRSSHTPGEP